MSLRWGVLTAPPITPVQRFVEETRKRTRNGLSIDSAVRHVASLEPALCWEVLEIIGSWPSSEPELRGLQRWSGR